MAKPIFALPCKISRGQVVQALETAMDGNDFELSLSILKSQVENIKASVSV
jgi:hypothetical protein